MSVIGHNALATKLARHMLAESRMVYEDIPVGRSGSIRPDVLTIEKSYTKPNPAAYEIKVSLADFRSDTTSGKWMGYLNYAWSVTFVVPRGLVKKSDIPDKCGLVTYNEDLDTFVTIKKPTVDPRQLDSEMLLKLLIEGSGRETEPGAFKVREARQYYLDEKIRKKFGKNIGEKIALVQTGYKDCRKQYLKMKKEAGEFFGVDVDRWCFWNDCSFSLERMKESCSEDARHEAFIRRAENFKEKFSNDMSREIEKLGGDFKTQELRR